MGLASSDISHCSTPALTPVTGLFPEGGTCSGFSLVAKFAWFLLEARPATDGMHSPSAAEP